MGANSKFSVVAGVEVLRNPGVLHVCTGVSEYLNPGHPSVARSKEPLATGYGLGTIHYDVYINIEEADLRKTADERDVP